MTKWMFTYNPDYYDLDRRLRDGLTIDHWRAARYRNELNVGDLFYIWQTGYTSGIIGFGVIAGEPFKSDESKDSYWTEPRSKGHPLFNSKVIGAVPITVRVWLNPIRGKENCETHPVLRDASVIKTPWLGNPHYINDQQSDAFTEQLLAEISLLQFLNADLCGTIDICRADGIP